MSFTLKEFGGMESSVLFLVSKTTNVGTVGYIQFHVAYIMRIPLFALSMHLDSVMCVISTN